MSYDEKLAWALRHPDGDRAITAAKVLGTRRARSALPALRQVAGTHRDPYLATAALRSAISIAGIDELRDLLELLAKSELLMVRKVAREALGRRS